jgi:hypothetical protein
MNAERKCLFTPDFLPKLRQCLREIEEKRDSKQRKLTDQGQECSPNSQGFSGFELPIESKLSVPDE